MKVNTMKYAQYALVVAIGLNLSIMLSSFAMQQPAFSFDIKAQIESWESVEPKRE